MEGFYRLVNNPKVNALDIIEPHIAMSVERATQVSSIYAIHDSTEMEYKGDVPRRGLGPLRGQGQGYLSHLALGVEIGGAERPIGVLGLRNWARTGEPTSRTETGRKKTGADYAKDAEKESDRWGEVVGEVSARLRGRVEVVHVMDREGDAYPLLAQMVENSDRFIVRAAKDRNVGAEIVFGVGDKLSDALEGASVIGEREISISARKAIPAPRGNKSKPSRERREAELEIRAMVVVLKRPRYASPALPEWLALNIVHVVEKNGPEDQDPVEWKLYTTEAIDTKEKVLHVVDGYCCRWIIEEYFQALKTGCQVEERQHESYEALSNMAAIFMPIAWQLLLLRNLARKGPDLPATAAITEQQVEVLCACAPVEVPEHPTVKQALLAIAALGGHIKSNGEPGWRVLGRGFERLLTLELGWAARACK